MEYTLATMNDLPAIKALLARGVFEGIFKASLKQFEDQYPVMVTFINQINGRSYAAHTKKAHMTEIGTFDFNDNHYWMMAIRTR